MPTSYDARPGSVEEKVIDYLQIAPPDASTLTISGSPFTPLPGCSFIFPSRYLFAIGLPVIFSLGWGLPPASGCTLKQPDSQESAEITPRP